jgi:polar amino acid transport system permease protein
VILIVALVLSASIGEVQAGPGAPSIIATIVKWTPLLAQGFALNIAMSFLAMGIGTSFGVALDWARFRCCLPYARAHGP